MSVLRKAPGQKKQQQSGRKRVFYCLSPWRKERKYWIAFGQGWQTMSVLAFAAAGKEESEVDFHITDDLDGSGIANGIGLPGNVRKVKLTSIDNEVAAKRLKPPFGIKLDTHGFEVPILEGAEKTLRDTVFVIIECYGFKIASGSLLFWEMCQYMSRRGFRLFDVVDTMRRPADRAFWQCDACFIRDNQPLFANNRYQ